VTVLTPAYNAAPYVREAVESIRKQTFGQFEYLIFDDGSTDRTPGILQQLAREDERIQLFLKPQGNKDVPTHTRWLNEGIEMARGEYIARMDADDISLPERLARQVAYMDAHPNCVLLGGGELAIDEQGDPIELVRHPQKHEEIDSHHISLRPRGSRMCQICHPTVMMRRQAVLDVGGYWEDRTPAEDLDLWLRLAERGRLANLPETLVHRRIHSTQVSRLYRDHQLERVAHVVELAYERRAIAIPPDLRSRLPEASLAVGTRRWIIQKANFNGYWRTARKHALRELAFHPWSVDAWRLALRMSLGWGASRDP